MLEFVNPLVVGESDDKSAPPEQARMF